jgi:RimJ/RimL family protein N-acetyltransferase
MSVQVRDAEMQDMMGCHLCLDAVSQEGRWLSRLRAAPLDRYAAFWALLREAKAPQTVAIESGTVVGWCDINLDGSPVRAHVGSLGMGLVASHRGRGLGRRLLTHTLERARDRGLERVELSVLHDNKAARALYERVGFIEEGRRIRDWKHEGAYRDSILMAAFI